MLIQTLRPKTFSEVAGQNLPKAILRSIVLNPTSAPRSIILSGPYGTGKTSQARIFARALNCEHPHANGDPCLKCSSCKQKLDESPFYSEYDASQLKLDTIRNLTDTWFNTLKSGYTVRVLDECHLLSRQVQSALLKTIEEPPKNTFFVFASTDPEYIIPTIRSRSLEIMLEAISPVDMKANLEKVCKDNGITISETALNRIIKVSKGHMRNAHMMLDNYLMLGEEKFLQAQRSSYDSVHKYFVAIGQKSTTQLFASIDEILQYPLSSVEDDFKTYVKALTKDLVTQSDNPVVKLLGANTLKLVKLFLSDWVLSSFKSDVEMQTALLAVYQLMNDSPVQRAVSVSPNARR